MGSNFQSTLLTVKQLSERTGIPVGTLCNWRSPYRGRGPKPVKLTEGKKPHVRYKLADVIEWENNLQYFEENTTKQNAMDEVERVA